MTTAARAAAVALSAAVVLAGALQGASAHPVAQVSLAGKPGLYPSFDPRIHDYVSRCGAKSRLKLTAAAPKGSTASVDGGHARSGTFTTDVHLGGGQGLVVRTSSSSGAE